MYIQLAQKFSSVLEHMTYRLFSIQIKTNHYEFAHNN